MKKKVTIVVALALVVVFGAVGTQVKFVGAGPVFELDHFNCYKVTPVVPFGPLTLSLEDQFEDLTRRVLSPVLICAPVDKFIPGNGGTETNLSGPHLTCYQMLPVLVPNFVQRKVRVNNQFGSQDLTVTARNNLLCVPSDKCVLNNQIPPQCLVP